MHQGSAVLYKALPRANARKARRAYPLQLSDGCEAWCVGCGGVSGTFFIIFNSAYRAVVRRRRRALCVRASRDRKGRALKHPIHTHLFSGWIPFGGAGRRQGEPSRAKGITSSRPSREHGSCVDAAARCRERVGDPRIGPFFFFAHDVGVFFLTPLLWTRPACVVVRSARWVGVSTSATRRETRSIPRSDGCATVC
jgi:hypothetical protein